MREINFEDFGRRVRKRRTELGLTQGELADRVGTSLSFVGHIERGTRKASLDTLVALSNALEISTDELLVDSLEPRQQERAGKLHLNQNQRMVMREILYTLHQHLGEWDSEKEK